MKSFPAANQALAAARIASEKLGEKIVIIDVRAVSSLTDCFLFVSGTSHLHIRALEDAIREGLKETGASLKRTDGQRGHLWRVLDYGSLIIHLMDQKTRDFYAIERLWSEGRLMSFNGADVAVPVKAARKKPRKPAPRKKKPTKK